MIPVGVAIYVPFLRLNDRLAVRNAKEEMDGLISFIREKEKLIIDMTVSSIAEVSKECGPDFRISMNHLKDQGHVMMIDDFGMGQHNS